MTDDFQAAVEYFARQSPGISTPQIQTVDDDDVLPRMVTPLVDFDPDYEYEYAEIPVGPHGSPMVSIRDMSCFGLGLGYHEACLGLSSDRSIIYANVCTFDKYGLTVNHRNEKV